MVFGIAIMEWNDRSGAELIATYPEDFGVNPQVLLQIFSQHEYSSEAGFVSLMSEHNNIASYYTGSAHQLYVIALLADTEDGTVFEDGLADIGRNVLLHKESDKLPSILEKEFKRLEIYPRINTEQRLALVYLNDIKRTVLYRLREECVLLKTELGIWIKDRFQEGEIDIDTVINSVLKSGICKVGSVKEYSSDLLYMISDMMITRKPPAIFRNPTEHHCPESLKKAYQLDVRKYFSDYHPTEADNLEIINRILLDPANYTVLELLRLAVVTRTDFEKLKRKGVEDIDAALDVFKYLGMITVLHDSKGVEYFGLVSDFEIHQFFPEYMLNSIRENYQVKRHSNVALLAHLDILEEEFLRLYRLKKKPISEDAPDSYLATDSPLTLQLDSIDSL